MKRFFISFALVFSMLFSFTACNEDQELAWELSGCWEGNLGMSYKDVQGVRVHSNRTQIYFNCFFETKGDGYQLDLYTDGVYDAVFHKFTWDITNEVISIVYDDPQMSGFNTRIYNYNLDAKQFSGYFGDSDEKFVLNHVDTFNWYSKIAQFKGVTDYIQHYNSGEGSVE